MKKKIKNIIYSFCSIGLCLIMSAIFISSSMSSGLNKEVAKAENNTYEQIEILKDVSEDFSFEIKSDEKIYSKDLDSFVQVRDASGQLYPILMIEKDDSYIIKPQYPYEKGKSYNVQLKNAYFKEDCYGDSLTFTVSSPIVEKVEYKSSVIQIEQERVLMLDPGDKVLQLENQGETFVAGDILIIPTLIPETNYYVDVAYKIEKIEGCNIEFSTPELEEVYSEFQINNTYTSSEVMVYEKEVIQEEILNNSEIESISKALYDISQNIETDEFVNYNTELSPKKIDIEFKNFNPLDVIVQIEWEITDDLNLSLNLQYENDTTVSFYASETEKRQITTEEGTWSISAELAGDILDPNMQELFSKIQYRNKYAEMLKESYEADKVLKGIEDQLKKPNLTEGEIDDLNLKKLVAQTAVDYTNLDKKFLMMENKNAAILGLKTLSDYYKKQMNESESVIKFVQLFFPVASGVAFTTDVGAVLDFSISAALTSKLVINSINEIGTVTTQNTQEDHYNAYYQVSGFIGVCGQVEFKVGAHVGVGVTIAGVFNLNLTLEGGLYFEFGAIGAVYIGDKSDLNLNEDEYALFQEATIKNDFSSVGSVNFEVGSYYLLNFTVSFDLWVVDVSKTFEVIGDKESFLQDEQQKNDVFKELVFEEDIGLDTFEAVLNGTNEIYEKGNRYDSTRTFEFPEGADSLQIPNIYIRTINLRNGEINYELVDPSSLIFINQDEVYFNGLTCRSRDYYALEIDNRVNIRIEEDDSGMLSLPIRILKKPVAVESITVTLRDQTNEIGLTEEKLLEVEILPFNATYQNFQYTITKIQKSDGSLYQNDLSQYAYLKNGYLVTTSQIQIGAKIYITAETMKEGVESNELIIEVKRIPIERIIFRDENSRVDINLGEEMPLNLKIFPENATINILNDESINVYLASNSDCALLEKYDDFNYCLTAYNDVNNNGKVLEIAIEIGNKQYVVSYQIGLVPIESIVLYNGETNSLLDTNISLTRNSVLKVSTIITPANASIGQVNYNLFSEESNYGIYISVNNEGVITVSDDAPFGLEILLTATSLYHSTEIYTITIAQVPVDSVLLSSENSYIVKNTIMYLDAYIYPGNADITSTVYKIVNDVTGVFISGNMLFASSSTVAGTAIEIVAVVSGVESNVLTIYVIDNNTEEIKPSEGGNSGEEFEHISTDSREIETRKNEENLYEIIN